MKFSEKIKAARLYRGMSQTELANVSDLSLRTIQNYESGTEPKQTSTYTRLASALHITAESLMDDDANFEPTETDDEIIDIEEVKRNGKELAALFAGGRLAEEDVDEIMKALQQAYWISKEKRKSMEK